MQSLRIVFAGTPEFAVPSLRALLDHPHLELVAVYTQPDRPAGRGRRPLASPVKRLALRRAVPVEQPETLSTPAACERLAAYRPDLLVVAAYGLMVPRAILELPCVPVNVHASLLPRWRGAAPIQRAIIAGDERTGISIMRLVERLDAGPVWLTRSCPIEEDDTGGTLHDRLCVLGAEALIAAIDRFRRGAIRETPQDDAAATYAPKITRADRDIDFTQAAPALARRIRALDPLPGARARVAGMDVKLFDARAEDRSAEAPPGEVVGKGPDAIRFATGEGILAVRSLQPPGRRRMSAAAFGNGYGERL